jgi:uncharacterized protein YcbX
MRPIRRTPWFLAMRNEATMRDQTIERLRALYAAGRFEVRRFRPNIVVLHITGPWPRCVMTTLAQGDLPKDSGIVRTAAQHNQANVGVDADVVAGGTRGDPIAVT